MIFTFSRLVGFVVYNIYIFPWTVFVHHDSHHPNDLLVGGFSPTHLKHMLKKNWDHFPKVWGENNKDI